MSTPTQAQEFSTAEYAAVLGGDQDPTAAAPTQTSGTEKKQQQDSTKTTKQEKQQNAEAAPSSTSTIGSAKNWMPGDFASAAPSSLVDAVGKHRDRYQQFDNMGVRVLYGMVYVPTAVIGGFTLNVISLLAAHASIALNEPERIRESVLGILFIVIIGAALVAFLG